jgi:hypothetical protein
MAWCWLCRETLSMNRSCYLLTIFVVLAACSVFLTGKYAGFAAKKVFEGRNSDSIELSYYSDYFSFVGIGSTLMWPSPWILIAAGWKELEFDSRNLKMPIHHSRSFPDEGTIFCICP